MTRAERKARLARQAVAVLAQRFAKSAVINHIRAQGLRMWDFTSKDITLWAEIWLREHPQIFAQARVRAAELGFLIVRDPLRERNETEIAQCPTSTTSPSTTSLPSSRS